MKKALSLLLAFISITVLCSSCVKSPDSVIKDYPITVNGTPIDGEIFSYYLDEAYEKAEEQTRDGRITYATNQCIRYVATNSTFFANGLELTAAEGAALSEEANAMWSLFGAHYSALGITKQTFIKIRTNAAYTEKLRMSLYDEGGATPIPDSKLQEYFAAYFVAFKLVRGYLFTTDIYGNTSEYSQEELIIILDRYNRAAEQINGNTSIEFVYPSLVSGDQEIEQALKTVVIADADPYYPEGFYKEVRAIQPGKATVCVFDDYLYLVYRVDILADPELFKNNRDICLKAVSEIPLQNEITRMCNAYTSVRRPKVVDKIYSEIQRVRKDG